MLSSGMARISTQEKALDVPRAAYARPCSSNASGLHGRNSARIAGPSASFGKSARAFKGIICDDVSEFESDMPSHADRSPRVTLLRERHASANHVRDKLAGYTTALKPAPTAPSMRPEPSEYQCRALFSISSSTASGDTSCWISRQIALNGRAHAEFVGHGGNESRQFGDVD
jgi:hypothetical protein